MSSVESDFADHRGDGPHGGFIIWLIPVLWPFIIILAMFPTGMLVALVLVFMLMMGVVNRHLGTAPEKSELDAGANQGKKARRTRVRRKSRQYGGLLRKHPDWNQDGGKAGKSRQALRNIAAFAGRAYM